MAEAAQDTLDMDRSNQARGVDQPIYYYHCFQCSVVYRFMFEDTCPQCNEPLRRFMGRHGVENYIRHLMLIRRQSVQPPAASRDNLSTTRVKAEDIRDRAQCSICIEDLKLDEVVKKLPCNHLFHPVCVGTWLKEDRTCPLCRNPVCVNAPSQGQAEDGASPSSQTLSS